jgi:TatD DNase family protein
MWLNDTHTHLHFDQYIKDLSQVLLRADQKNVERILTLGTDLASSRASIKIANQYKNVYAAVGIHPTDIHRSKTQDVLEIKKLASNEVKVIAIGEIGLDLYWKEVPIRDQLPVFEKMLDVANELEIPVVVHNREAQQEMRDFFSKHQITSLNGVMHSFSGNEDDAQFYLEKDLYISFTGVITFKNFKQQRVVQSVPLDRILLETDSPFLTPVPHRGQRNEPSYVEYVARQLAKIYQISYQKICQTTFDNAIRLFHW